MDKRLQAITLNFDLEKKEGQINLLTKDKALQELDLKRQKTIRNAIGISGILLLILAIGLFNRYKYVRKTKKIIEDEKERSEKLLLNILPVETAEELKAKGSATPKHYDMVSVLFTDFKGFTKIAEKLTPQELVEELNQCFLEFDRIIDRHNIEKIKTIGDAYMCAGGIPVANQTNPVDIVKAGLEIKEYMEKLKSEREARGEDYWELRIGIHTGPVIAGVVGKNKFAYDIWGDAVNTASRMESSGIPGQVNISGATYELIKEHFQCTHRGKIQAKNKGEIDMYIVEGIQTQPSEKSYEAVYEKS
jgi:class 3 adenylate cyclase